MTKIVFSLLLFCSSSVVFSQTLTFSTVQSAAIIRVNEAVLAEAYRRLGIIIQVRNYPAARALIESNSGKVDGELYRMAGISNRFHNLIMVPTPISSIEWMVFTRDQDLKVNGWASIASFNVAVERGILYVEQQTIGMKRELVNDNLQMMKMLELDRVQLVVDTRLDGASVLRGLKNHSIRMLEPPLAKIDLHHYLHKRHQALVPKLDAILKQLQREGLAEQLTRSLTREMLGE